MHHGLARQQHSSNSHCAKQQGGNTGINIMDTMAQSWQQRQWLHKKSKEQQSRGDAAASAMLWSMGASAVSALMTKTWCTAATAAAAHDNCKEQQSTGRNSGYGIALVPLLTVW